MMLENRINETGGDDKANRDNRLSELAWKPELIAEGKGAGSASEKAGENGRTQKDPLKEHVKINDRCSLDIYEHHWELTMPKVTLPLTQVGMRLNSKGIPELVGVVGKEEISHEKLMMDDRGIWTMKDGQGQSVQVTDDRTVSYALDPAHPEKKTQVKQKDFSNGTSVMIESSGNMVLIRDQDHEYASKEGTPAYVRERTANRFIVGFSKKDGVTTVFDQNKAWTIKRTKDSP